VAHGGMWIYIDPSTAYRDARIGEQLDGIIHPQYHTHPPDRERPKNQPRASGASRLDPRRSRQHAVASDLASSGPAGLVKFALHCLAQRPPLLSGSETPALASEDSHGVRRSSQSE
jgi:hypothetical protein